MQRKVVFVSPTEKVYVDLVTGYVMRSENSLEIEISEEEYKALIEMPTWMDRVDFACNLSMLTESKFNITINNQIPELGEKNEH